MAIVRWNPTRDLMQHASLPVGAGARVTLRREGQRGSGAQQTAGHDPAGNPCPRDVARHHKRHMSEDATKRSGD